MNADTFFVVKGFVSLIATVLLIAYMVWTWNDTTGWAQRLRFLTLLYFAVLITAASVEQTQEHAAVNYRNVGALIGAVLLIVTTVVSLVEYRRKRSG